MSFFHKDTPEESVGGEQRVLCESYLDEQRSSFFASGEFGSDAENTLFLEQIIRESIQGGCSQDMIDYLREQLPQEPVQGISSMLASYRRL